MTHKGQSTRDHIIFDCKDPWERLAMAIIMDGLRSHDKKYFYSDDCANLFHALGIHGDPILYYAAYINQRKRGAKKKMTINGIVCKTADEQRTAIKTLLMVASIYWHVVAKWQDETKQARL